MLSIGVRAKVGFAIASALLFAFAFRSDPVVLDGFVTESALSEVPDRDGDSEADELDGLGSSEEDEKESETTQQDSGSSGDAADAESSEGADNSSQADSSPQTSDDSSSSPDILAFTQPALASRTGSSTNAASTNTASSGGTSASNQASNSDHDHSDHDHAGNHDHSDNGDSDASGQDNSGQDNSGQDNSGQDNSGQDNNASSSGHDHDDHDHGDDSDNSDGSDNSDSSDDSGNSDSSGGSDNSDSSGGDSGNDSGGNGGIAPVNYTENLSMIRAQTVRNTNHDGSQFANTPQASLPIGDNSPLMSPRSSYLDTSRGNNEGHFPIPNGGQFRVQCEFSHFAYDDPILFPNQPGKAHLHMFFGNTDVNAYSTVDTLNESGSSTCNGAELNRTGYWVPAMIDGNGNARIPERVVVYYKGEGLANGANHPQSGGSQPYVRGMANISPAPASVAEVPRAEGGQVGQVNYKCSNNFSAYPYETGVNEIPNCDGDYYTNRFGARYPITRSVLEMEIKFWNCFDSSGVLSDWQSWVPAGQGHGGWFFSNCNGTGGGPSTPERQIFPNMSYFVNYVIEPGEDTSQWYLSSDVDPDSVHTGGSFAGPRGSTHHADWWGGWHPDINQEWLDNCVNFLDPSGAASGCGFGYLSNAGPDRNNPIPGRALKLRPDYDVVGDSDSYKVPMQDLYNQLCIPLNPGRFYSTPMASTYCVADGHNHSGHSH